MAGLKVPNETLKGVNKFLDRVSTPDGSGLGYDKPQPTLRMTAAGLLCRQHMGWGPRNASLAKGVESLRKQLPAPNFKDLYYYYYATQVLHNFGGEAWEQWNPKMRDLLIENQDQGQGDHRHQKGSWAGEAGQFEKELGRLGNTALAVLILEVYYRYPPPRQE